MTARDPSGAGTAALVGAGLVGRAWAAVFASHGWTVRMFDIDREARRTAKGLVRAALGDLHAHGLAGDPDAATAQVHVCQSLEQALEGASFVQESLPELVEIKREVFAEFDRLAAPDAILSSSTSAIASSSFTADLAGRHRCLVGHPVNPPHLVPLVEVCPAPWTSPETTARALAVYAEIGQVPIFVRKEVEGFVLNRLQGALMTEALRLVEGGVVSPQDIDKTVKDGLGLRWSFMGPFETIELNAPDGIPDYAARYGPFYARVAADPPAASLWNRETVETVTAQWGETPSRKALAAKRAWRDDRLARILAEKKRAAEAHDTAPPSPRSAKSN